MKIGSLLALIVVTCGLAFGQIPVDFKIPPIGNAYDQVKAYLALTDAQLQALQQIQKTQSDAEAAIYQEIKSKQEALNAELGSASPNPLEVGRLTIEVNNLFKRLPLSGTPNRASALAVLSVEQKNKLPVLAAALELGTPAYQAVSLNLIDNPNSTIIRGTPGVVAIGN